MKKIAFVFLLGLMVFQSAKAQKHDTLKFYLRNTGELVSTSDSADYYRLVMPPDKNSSSKLFPVKDFYINGAPKLTGASSKKILDVFFAGTCISFYPNGKTKSVENYTKDGVKTDLTMYYRNGQLYCIKRYKDYKEILVTCHDSTGKVLADNENGTWLKYDDDKDEDYGDNKVITGEGSIKNGLRDGEWHGSIGDSIKYTCFYKDGKITSGTGYDKGGKAYPFTELIQYPANKGISLIQYFVHNVRYPAIDRENNVMGKVILSYFVEKDGHLSHLKILRAPSKTLGDAVLHVMNLSPDWTIGEDYGIPVSRQYTTNFNFTLAED